VGRNVLNLTQPEPRQVWQHVTSGATLLILTVDEIYGNCVLLNEAGTASSLQVMVPLEKFKCYGNRGLRLIGSRKGVVPKLHPGIGEYNPRLLNLGAVQCAKR